MSDNSKIDESSTSNSSSEEEDEEEEINYMEAMKNILTDETLHDVILEGTDGVKIHANRVMLAARSKVFHRMLVS